MKSVIRKTTIREIKQSFGRYFAILAIVALGVGFFAGLKVTKTAMVDTVQDYIEETSLYDFRLLSTLGFEEGDAAYFAQQEGVRAAEGAVSADVLYKNQEGNEGVMRVHSLPERINRVTVLSGRLPENPQECVVDSNLYSEDAIGSKVILSENNEEETLDLFTCQEYEIVGIVEAVYYMNFERGNTSLETGRVNGFMYIMPSAWDCDYETEIFVKLDHDYAIYTPEYEDYIEAKETEWEKICEERVNSRYESLIADAEEELEDAERELEEKRQEAEEKLGDAKAELEDAQAQIEDGEKQIEKAEREITQQSRDLDEFEQELLEQENMLLQQETLTGMTFPEMWVQIEAGKAQIETGRQQLQSARTELSEKREELEENRQKVTDAQEEYEKAEAEAKEKIAEGEQKIQDAREELADLERPDSYVLNRNTNIGYACFENDSAIVEGIANVFPIFFFMVAALVCMTTMNRMVEEQRTQIGVLKALGYQERTIMGKYMFYAGSAAVTGSIGGFLAGTYAFPKVIWEAYHIMYNLPDLKYIFDGKLAVISLLVSLLCSIGVTWFTCRQELMEVTAELMRPKAPKAGKRIVLERIPFVWKRLKFLHKVSIRNIFRYKKRFFMMVIGIGGCTALLLTGFGVKDSITDVATKQFHEIQIYDMSVMFKEPLLSEENADFMTVVTEWADEYMYVCEKSMDMVVGKSTKSVNIIIPEKTQQISEFLDLHDADGTVIDYPKTGEAVISNKIGENYHIKVGDTLTIRNEDMKEITVKISGISENFVYNYVYINAETYQNGMGEKPEYKTAYLNMQEGKDVHKASAAMMDLDSVSAVTANIDVEERFANMMKSMDYIVLLIIICAACLAFIVLYNLTNINITERIREIATIKVLGFYKNETASYVFRENVVLTAVGSLLGLILGYFLHRFVMNQINVDIVSFDVHIKTISYGYSLLFTFLFTGLVNFMMSFKLEKVNMAESLKSVD